MSLLEQDITRKSRINEKTFWKQKTELEFQFRDNKDYEVKVIIDNAIYGQQTNNQIPSLYYLIL